MGVRLRFEVLGPLRCLADAHEVPLSTPRERTLLAILLLRACEPVPAATLIDAVWGELLPRNARGQLQSSVWRLRQWLADAGGSRQVVATDPIGYRIEVGLEELDLLEFRRLRDEARAAVATGEPDRANDHYRAALGLWRGPALAGLDNSAVRDHAVALDEEYIQALEACIAIELERGKGADLVPELTRCTRQYPYREKLHGALMLALYRAGRQADALAAYQRARQLLQDNLGIEPGDNLQTLHKAVLNRDPTLDLPRIPESGGTVATFVPAKPRMLPADIPDFVGRTSEVKSIRALLTQAMGTAVRVVAISGAAGTGKTALSVHLAHLLQTDYYDGQLYVNLRGFDKARAVDPAEALGRFLRSLGVTTGDDSPVDERADLYRSLLVGRRILVVLDNARTEEQILPLLPGGSECGVLLNSRLPLGIELGAKHLRLGPLDKQTSAELVGRIVGVERTDRELDAVGDLVRLCGYLPLAVRIAAGKLAVRPHWSVSKLTHQLRNERERLNHLSHRSLDVRVSIGVSYSELSEVAKQLLRRLGDLGLTTVTTWTSAALLDTTPDRVEHVLEELVESQLLEVVGQDHVGYVRYRSHDLVRLYAKERAREDESPEELTVARFRTIGAWLFVADAVYESLRGGDDYVTVHSTARRQVVDSEIAAALVSDPQAWFEAERENLVAIIRIAATDHPRACWDLASTASPLFRLRRHFDQWSSVLESALAAARRCGDDLAVAAILWRLADLRCNRQDFRGAWELFRQAADLFATCNAIHAQAAMTAHMASMERFQGQREDALRHYSQALPVLRETSDRGGEALVLRSVGQIYLDSGDELQAENHFKEALAVYESLGWRRGQAQTNFWLGMLRLKQSRYAVAHDLFTRVLTYSREQDDRSGEIQALRGLGLCHLRTGQSDPARRVLTEALRLAVQPEPTLLEGYVRQALASLDQSEGQPGEDARSPPGSHGSLAVSWVMRAASPRPISPAPSWSNSP